VNIKPKRSVTDDNVNRNKSVLYSHTLGKKLAKPPGHSKIQTWTVFKPVTP